MTTDIDTVSPRRNFFASEFVTLDGVTEAPEVPLGRRTYESSAAAWPDRERETGSADRMDGLPKHVASTSLEEADWNDSTIVDGEGEEVDDE